MILSMIDIKKLCTETSFVRGLEYFQMGNVTNLEQFGNKITATVEGTRDYTVTIRTDKKEINMSYRELSNLDGYIEYGTEVNFLYIRDLADRYIDAGNLSPFLKYFFHRNYFPFRTIFLKINIKYNGLWISISRPK